MGKKPVTAFLVSLCILELLFFTFVYYSNHSLYKGLDLLVRAGHMVVPNGPVLSSLENILPAFYGSLFILFTAGIFIALMVCILVMAWMNPGFKEYKKSLYYGSVFFATLVISVAALVSLSDSSIFHRTRDFLLASNPMGTAVSQFYYAYSPYANHAISPQIQTPAGVWWINITGVVRFFCEAGLLAGLPFFGFSALFLSVFRICKRWVAGKIAVILTGIVLTGFTLVILVYLSPPGSLGGVADFEKMLASEKAKERVETLQVLYRKGTDIWQYPDYCKTAVKSPSIAERYWLSKALSKSDAKKSLPLVKGLVTDDAIHVRSSAIKALAKLSCDGETIEIFTNLMLTNPMWYEQQAAYTAFKECQ